MNFKIHPASARPHPPARSTRPSGPPAEDRIGNSYCTIRDDIASYFFHRNRVHFYLTPVRLTQAAAPRIVPRPQNAGRTMPPHISHRPVQNCINIRDATLHFISLYQVFKLTTSCSWFLLFSNALLKSKGRRMATSLSRRGLKIPRIYILDLTFTNMYRITRERKACG